MYCGKGNNSQTNPLNKSLNQAWCQCDFLWLVDAAVKEKDIECIPPGLVS